MLCSRLAVLGSCLLFPLIGFAGPQQQAPAYPIFESDHLPASLYAERRAAIKALLGQDGVGVFFTNPIQVRSKDTAFRFRPDSHFRYLTGFEEPNAVLILAPGGVLVDGKIVTEVLFCDTSSPMSETWLGYRMGPANAARILGIQSAAPNEGFEAFLKTINPRFRVAAQVGGSTPDLTAIWTKWQESAKLATHPADLQKAVDKMRVRKDPREIALLQKAVDATVQGHREAMRSIEAEMREYEIQAVVEYAFTRGGCESVGYNSIVGSGPNSCILHYEADRKLMKAGEIVCMDVAGEYHGYSADVTRSFPVSGKFSPAQKAIYELVLAAQDAGIAQCRVGNSFSATDTAARKVVAEGLVKLGITKTVAEVNRYFMHGTSHYIGLDVHDSHGDTTLDENYTLTVEPGIYIKAGSPCDKKWWNIGIRIEDDILVTAKGPVNMSNKAPRTVAAIEALMQGKGIGNQPIGN